MNDNTPGTQQDYAGFYDAYWNLANQKGSSSHGLAFFVDAVAALYPGQKILDAGCGEGVLVARLRSLGVEAHGFDVSRVAITRAKARVGSWFTVADAVALPFEDESFDAVVSADMLEHLVPRDVPLALAEIHRVARKGAFLQVAHINDAKRPGAHLTIEPPGWWAGRIAEAGFRELPHGFRPTRDWRTAFLLEK